MICPICAIGEAVNRVELVYHCEGDHKELLPVYYLECYVCGDFAGKEEMDASRAHLLEWRKSIGL